MFNLITRVQSVSNQALSVAVLAASLVSLFTLSQLFVTDVWNLNTTAIANIKPLANLKHSFNYGSVNKKPKENSKIIFDLDADLTPLFNWNTKQVFVYLTAEYPGKSDGSSNRVTYWDKIITTPEQAKFSIKNQRSKYSVWDVERSFRGREGVLRLEWNIQPWIGPLISGETGIGSNFTFASLEA